MVAGEVSCAFGPAGFRFNSLRRCRSGLAPKWHGLFFWGTLERKSGGVRLDPENCGDATHPMPEAMLDPVGLLCPAGMALGCFCS